MGSNLISKELLAAGDYEGIARNVAGALALIRKIRDTPAALATVTAPRAGP